MLVGVGARRKWLDVEKEHQQGGVPPGLLEAGVPECVSPRDPPGSLPEPVDLFPE